MCIPSSTLRSRRRATPLQIRRRRVGIHLESRSRYGVALLIFNNLLTREQSHGTHFPPMNPGYPDHRLSVDASSHFDSRRSSVDSRMNAGMTQLNIASPSSPYDSHNGSRVSLVSNLQHQRGIPGEPRHNGTSPLSPLGRNAQPRIIQPPKRAPVINPNPRSVSGMPDPMAAAPTKGYAWAFPGDDYPTERRQSSSGESSVDRSNVPSRQNSYATSITSSIMTADSKMPYGQQRLDDGMQTYSYQLFATTDLFFRHGAHPPPLNAASQRH
jgi:hypothetical protein